MSISGRRASFLLFAGDIATFAVSLFIALWIRSGELPSRVVLAPYLAPFAFLFALWVLVFYMAGLYSKRLVLFPSRVPDALIGTQVANILLAALFFFFVPVFGITPKTILLLYLIVSLALIYLWRLVLYPKFSRVPRPERALLVAQGKEAEALAAEVNSNPRYGFEFHLIPQDGSCIEPAALLRVLHESHATTIVFDASCADIENLFPVVYSLTHGERQMPCAAFEDVYEEVFDRVLLSQLRHAWFLAQVSPAPSPMYALTKRIIDLVGGVCMGIITLIVAPFIFIANHIEGPGPLFIKQERFGRYGARIIAYKFRSMRLNKAASGEWTTEEKHENPVTRVGGFLRRISLDEFPQFINVLSGEISLVGPRNDTLGLGKRLADAIPYYEARYLVKPGITGWAQINQQYEPGNLSPQSLEETKMRLAYDFYYLKHRSLGLDIVIALKTVKRMFFRLSSW